jgi:hypothetical protein
MLSIGVVNLYCFFLSDQEEPKLSGRAPTWSGVGVASIGACRTGASRAPAWRVTGVTSRRVSGWRSQRAPAAAATASRQWVVGGRDVSGSVKCGYDQVRTGARTCIGFT